MAAAANVVKSRQPQAAKAESPELHFQPGTDAYSELLRVRRLNARLTKTDQWMSIVMVVLAVMTVLVLVFRAKPVVVAVDPANRVYPIQGMTTIEPPYSVVADFTGDCLNGVLNGSFYDYEKTIGASVDHCFTADGEESMNAILTPFLADMRQQRTNIAAQFLKRPLVKSHQFGNRWIVDGVVQVAFRGKTTNNPPTTYTFQAMVVPVPYWSSIEGIRLDEIHIKPGA